MSALLPSLELIFGWLLAASWQASVLALVVLAIQRIFGARLNPRWRYALWLLVVVRLALPVLPESGLSLFQFAPPPPAALTVSVTEPLFVAAPPAPPVDLPLNVPRPVHPLSFYSLFALIWLAGAFGLLTLTVIVNRRFAQQVANSPEITDPELLRFFSEAKAEFHVHRPIRLIENGQVQSPAIMGLFHPTLLLPVDVREKFDARELRFIFLHELAHLKRGDVLVQTLIALLQILHWFNPVLWFAFRRMRIDREPATDALVLSRTGEDEKERYGLMLIKLLEHFNQRHSLATLVGILEDKDQFKRRFSLIARFTRGAYGWSVMGIALMVFLSVACLTRSKDGRNSLQGTGDTTRTLASEKSDSSLDIITSPPIYVSYTNVGIGAFGPVHHGSSISDDSRVPGTNESLHVWCKSSTSNSALLEFIASKPSGPSRLTPNGRTSQPVTERRTEQVVPVGKTFSFRIFDAVDVTISPSLDPAGNEIMTPIFQAIYSHDAARVKVLLAKGAVVKSTDMEAALEVGPPAVAKLLWDAGDRHVSEMTYAIDQGATIPDLKRLLTSGAQVEREDDYTITPLGMAARLGNVEVAGWLLKHGARINSSREAPLSLAVKGESVEMVDFLLKNGAKPDRDILAGSGSFGGSSLPDQMEKRVEMARSMIKAGALDHLDEASKSGLLIAACEQKNPTLLRLYLDSGIDPLVKVRDGKTALEIVQAAYARRDVDPAKQGMQPLIDILEAAQKDASTKAGSAELPATARKASVAAMPAALTRPFAYQLPQMVAFDATPGTHPELVPLFGAGAGKAKTGETDAGKSGDAIFSGQLTIPADAHADFAKSTGVLVSDTGTQYPLSFDEHGMFSVAGVKAGRYREVVHVVCEPRDHVIGVDKTFGFTEVAPGAHAHIVLGWDPTPPATDGIEIELKIVQIDEDVYQANKAKIDSGVEKDGFALIGLLNQLKGVSLLSAPSVTTKPGLKANIDIVREMPYPTEFEKPKMTSFIAGPGPGASTNLDLYIPPTPREFETKNIGVSAEITPALIGKTLSPQGTIIPDRIMLNGTFTVAEFEGFTQSNLEAEVTPTFNTSESHFVEAVADGELKAVWIPGSHYRTADTLDAMPGVKMDPTAPTIKTRYLLLLSAREVD